MYSHEQLINAVRAAGRDGKTFSVKDIRAELGFETRDKKELSRFRRRLRAFEKDVGEALEKVGNNSYRLKPGSLETVSLETVSLETAAPETAVADAAKKHAKEPVSGVFETIAAPELEAPTPAQPEAAPSPIAAAAAVQPTAAPALHVEPPTAAGALHVEEQSPAAVALHVAEQPVANDAPVPAPQPLAARVEHVVSPVTKDAPAPAQPAPQPVAARVEHATVSPAPAQPAPQAVAVRVEHAATNGAPKPAAAKSSASNGAAAHSAQPSAAGVHAPQPSAATSVHTTGHSVNPLRGARQLATAIVSSALAASAAVSGRVRERSHNLREQLWTVIRAVPIKQRAQPAQHIIARLRGWAEGLRPLSGQVRNQLNALRQRVRRA